MYIASDHPNDASPIASRPVCSSHYDRQLIYYSFILALNGQEFDTRDGLYKLKIDPKVPFSKHGDCVALLLPHASTIACVNDDFKDDGMCFDIKVMFGRLVLDRLHIKGNPIDLKGKRLILDEHAREVVCF